MNMPVTELGYLGFEVSDMARWTQFASHVLGLGVSQGPTGDQGQATQLLRMDDASHRIVLTQGTADDCIFAGWRAADAAAVEQFSRKLTGLGLKWDWGTEDELALRAVECMVHFCDPEGNRHEVFSGQKSGDAPFESEKVLSGFVTGAGGLGHIVYEVSDYPAAVNFAQQVLGLRLSDHIDLQVAPGVVIEIGFFHANERHHSYAVAPRPPVPGPQKRIHHFMLEVGAMADVGHARDRCLSTGHPVGMDLGQHPNDKMISFYGQTPSGFFVEFGCGGVIVDEASWKATRYDQMSEWGHRPAGTPAAHPVQVNGTNAVEVI